MTETPFNIHAFISEPLREKVQRERTIGVSASLGLGKAVRAFYEETQKKQDQSVKDVGHILMALFNLQEDPEVGPEATATLRTVVEAMAQDALFENDAYFYDIQLVLSLSHYD